MNKLFYLACLSFLTLTGICQTSILLTNYDTSTPLAPNATVFAVTQPQSNLKINIDIKNTSATTQTYTVKRKDLTLHSTPTSTAVAYFCIAGTCYGDLTTQPTNPLVLNSLQSASELQGSFQMLTGYLDEAETVGYSKVKYEFENVNNAADAVAVYMEYNSPNSTVGIYKISNNTTSFDIYPNPVTNGNVNFKMIANATNSSKATIYNSLGTKVAEKELFVNEGVTNFSFDGLILSSGVYFLSTTNGNSSITKKFIVE